MKLEQKDRTFSSNTTDTKNFGIVFNDKLFEILADNLYKNPIRATLRELGCNAIDSHKAADNLDTPFYLHLPTEFDPVLKIRDFGTGMSADTLVEIFVNYNRSTKTESNDYTGALGIGSKSPFAYGSAFNATSFYNGKKHILQCFKDENGLPSYTDIITLDTDEPNGVEVSFAVDSGDFRRFKDEAIEVFSFFEVKPDCNLEVDFSCDIFEQENFIPGVHLVKQGSGHVGIYRGELHARQGNIVYPICTRELTLNQRQREIANTTMLIDFPIGELNFTPSREDLLYTPATKANIEKRLQECEEKFDEVALEQIKDIEFDTPANFIAGVKQVSEMGLFSNLFGSMISDHITKTTTVSRPFDVRIDYSGYYTVSIDASELEDSGNVKMRKINKDHDRMPVRDLERIYFDCNSFYFFNNTKRGAIKKVKDYAKSKLGHRATVYYFEGTDEDLAELREYIEGTAPDKVLGYEEVVASQTEKTEKRSYVPTAYYMRHWSEWDEAPNWGKHHDITQGDDNKRYYIPLKNGKCELLESHYIKSFWRFCKKTLNVGPEPSEKLYGLHTKGIELVKDDPNWINLIEAAKIAIHTPLCSSAIYVNNNSVIGSLMGSDFNLSHIESLGPDNLFYKLFRIASVITLKNNYRENTFYKLLEFDPTSGRHHVEEYVTLMKEKYSMLSIVDCNKYWNDDDRAILLNYLKG